MIKAMTISLFIYLVLFCLRHATSRERKMKEPDDPTRSVSIPQGGERAVNLKVFEIILTVIASSLIIYLSQFTLTFFIENHICS